MLYFTTILIVINSVFLTLAMQGGSSIALIYFMSTQGILVWFFMDESSSRIPTSKFHALQPAMSENHARLAGSINRSLSPQAVTPRRLEPIKNTFIEMPPVPQNFVEDDQLQSIIFEAIPSRSQVTSNLQLFDDLMSEHQNSLKKLVIGNFHSEREKESTLKDVLDGYCQLPNILCKEITKNTDLIPYSGNIGSKHNQMASYFVRRMLKNYDQIIFIVDPVQSAYWKEALQYYGLKSVERENLLHKEAYQPASL